MNVEALEEMVEGWMEEEAEMERLNREALEWMAEEAEKDGDAQSAESLRRAARE